MEGGSRSNSKIAASASFLIRMYFRPNANTHLFYMRHCNGVYEKYQHHFVIKDITVVINTRNTSFCDAITNIYNQMLLKIFINTIAEPHVKKVI